MEKNFREWVKEDFKDYGSKAISYINRAIYDKLKMRRIENKDITEEQYRQLITYKLRQQAKKIEEQVKKEQDKNKIKEILYNESIKNKLGEEMEELTERYEECDRKIREFLGKTDDTQEDIIEMIDRWIMGIDEIENMNNRQK